ncbi:hypothetical protein GZH49_10890 [Nocardia terpenica]|uniref:hypothetical protein n=1 Tax=Nocardia terpenica TaxID=455432 RepID=UPI002FDF58BD
MTRSSIIFGYSPAQQRNLRRLAEAGPSGLSLGALAADEPPQSKGHTCSSLASLEREGLATKQLGQETVWAITEKGRLTDELIQDRRTKLENNGIGRVEALIERAAQAGYHLVRDAHSPHSWALLDEEDGARIYSAMTLDQIEQWLNE